MSTNTVPLRCRVGLLIPSSNTIMENDLHDHLDKQLFSVHTARMHLVETTADAERLMLDEHARPAADLVGTAEPDLLIFGCTSAGSLGGLAHDRSLVEELGVRAHAHGIGVLSSIVEAVSRRELRRIAVITPYIEELTASVAAGLNDQGFEVVAAAGMGIDVNVELARPTPEEIVDFTVAQLDRSRLDISRVDGIVISCTNFRGLEAASEITSRIGLPVITSNSAVIEAVESWAAARQR